MGTLISDFCKKTRPHFFLFPVAVESSSGDGLFYREQHLVCKPELDRSTLTGTADGNVSENEVPVVQLIGYSFSSYETWSLF